MKKNRSSAGSLDLLLDTITNTFGGVLFLAILVSLLLRNVGKQSSTQQTTAPIHEVELTEYQNKIHQYQTDIASLKKSLADHPIDEPDLAILNEELTFLLEDIYEINTNKAATLVEVIELQQRIAEERKKLSELPKELNVAEQQLADVQSNFESAQDESLILARTAIELKQRLRAQPKETEFEKPVLAPTTRPQIGLYLRYGRLYMMHKWSQDLVRQGPNPEHFFITDNGKTQIATPRPAAGIPVDSENLSQTIRHWLSPFPADKWVVALVTHPDSFQEFQVVKTEIIQEGYKYQPYPFTAPVIDTGGESMAQ